MTDETDEARYAEYAARERRGGFITEIAFKYRTITACISVCSASIFCMCVFDENAIRIGSVGAGVSASIVWYRAAVHLDSYRATFINAGVFAVGDGPLSVPVPYSPYVFFWSNTWLLILADLAIFLAFQ